MMKHILTTLTLMFTIGNAYSQSRLSVNNLQIEQKGNRVEVSFDASGAHLPFNINNTYTFTPSILKDGKRRSLAPIVYGSRRAEILGERRGVVADKLHRKSDTVRYRFALPYESWMSDGALVMEAAVRGCCRTEMQKHFFLAQHILPTPVVEIVAQTPAELEPVAPPVFVASAGKRMSDKYSFVAPHSELSGKDGKPMLDFTLPLRMGKAADEQQQRTIEEYFSQNDEGALKIYFYMSKTVIDPMLSANAESMKQLLEAVNAINNSSDSQITDIVIAGFASPEGTLDQNEQLSWKRVLAIKEFLTANTKVETDQIHLYNGGENWMGLRKLVAQGDMKHREEVLQIMDNVSVRKGREKQLMDLHIGNTYRYMMEHYFPKLRHAACIKIYYKETN